MASASTGLHRVSVRLIHSGATSSVHSPPPYGEGLGVGVHMKEREPPPPTPPHTRSARALLAGEGSTSSLLRRYEMRPMGRGSSTASAALSCIKFIEIRANF